ncbi:zinc finger protein 583-like isoform X2 [Ambystoma mexicanum]|uniref:zinc finger protein 583-like isoform X2 n=1 Tax=Ambystoma mexicanum TaxID=8296 RepID=UPI0037E945EE
MSQKDSDAVTFHEVSAFFSEEEWKLLQEWQKELYRNVMKEIHQALISLGPLITTTVCSLRAKEKDQLHSVDTQSRERRPRLTPSQGSTTPKPAVLLRTESEEYIHPNNPLKSEGREANDCLRGGFPGLNPDIPLRKEQEQVSIFIDHLGATIEESVSDPTTGYEVVSLCIKDENVAYEMEHQDSQRMDVPSRPTGKEGINRKKKVGGSLKYPERSSPCKAFPGPAGTMVQVGSQKEATTRNFRDLRAEKSGPSEGGFRNPVHFSVHQPSLSIGVSGRYDAFEGSLSNSQFPNVLANTQQHPQRASTCAGVEKSYLLKGEYTRHMRLHSRERPYACTECGKRFFQKSCLIAHYRTHSSEKPYVCNFCPKRFNRKDYLDGHIRIHTGERPYKCTKCEKSFVWKSHLNNHHRKHT